MYALEGRKPEQTVEELYRKHVERPANPQLVRQVVKKKRDLDSKLLPNTEACEGAPEVLEYLNSQGVPLAAVTGSSRRVAESTIQRLFPPDTITELRAEVEAWREESRRKDHIIAGLVERIPPQLRGPTRGATSA